MNYLTSLFAFCIAIGSFWLSLKLIRLYLQVKKWNRVNATLISKEVILHTKYSTAKAPYGIKVEYTYQVNNITYTGHKIYLTELAGGQVNFMKSDAEKRVSKLGDTLLVFVNPLDPNQSVIYGDGITFYIFIFSLGILSILFGLGNLF